MHVRTHAHTHAHIYAHSHTQTHVQERTFSYIQFLKCNWTVTFAPSHPSHLSMAVNTSTFKYACLPLPPSPLSLSFSPLSLFFYFSLIRSLIIVLSCSVSTRSPISRPCSLAFYLSAPFLSKLRGWG